MKVKAILFDFSKTLTIRDDDNRNKELVQYFNKKGLDSSKIQNIWIFHKMYAMGFFKNNKEFLNSLSKYCDSKSEFDEELIDIIISNEFVTKEICELIKEIHKDFRLGIVSGEIKDWILRSLKRVFISNLFDVIITTSDYGIIKPDPRLLHLALQKLQIAPNEAVYVSDKLNSDLSVANVVGVKTVWINNGKEEKTFEPNFTISNILEIKKVLEKL